MKKQLTYIEPRRAGIVMGIVHGLLGLILLPFALVRAVFNHTGGLTRVSGSPFSFFALLLPVLYAVAGFIGGIVVAIIYNWIAKRIGGLEFELQDVPAAYYLQPPDRLAATPLDIRSLIIGNWLGKAADNFVGFYTFYADGNMQCDVTGPGGSNKLSGNWEVEGDSVLAKWDKGDTDIIELTSPQQYRWTNAQFPGAVGIATRQ